MRTGQVPTEPKPLQSFPEFRFGDLALFNGWLRNIMVTTTGRLVRWKEQPVRLLQLREK